MEEREIKPGELDLLRKSIPRDGSLDSPHAQEILPILDRLGQGPKDLLKWWSTEHRPRA
jgi:hypothetical protein